MNAGALTPPKKNAMTAFTLDHEIYEEPRRGSNRTRVFTQVAAYPSSNNSRERNT